MLRDSSTNKLYRVLRSYRPGVCTSPERGAISPGFWLTENLAPKGSREDPCTGSIFVLFARMPIHPA